MLKHADAHVQMDHSRAVEHTWSEYMSSASLQLFGVPDSLGKLSKMRLLSQLVEAQMRMSSASVPFAQGPSGYSSAAKTSAVGVARRWDVL